MSDKFISGGFETVKQVEEKGGLVLKPNTGFKPPMPVRRSALGLDRLAQEKRIERRNTSPRKSSQETAGKRGQESPRKSSYGSPRKINQIGVSKRHKTGTPLKRSEWDQTPGRTPRDSGRAGSRTPRNDGRQSSRPRSHISTSRTNSNWETETPRTTHGDIPEGFTTEVWANEQTKLDRDWYNQEESNTFDDQNHAFHDVDGYYQKKEDELKKTQVKRVTARQAQFNKDNDLWEKNRMLQSGIVQQGERDPDHDEQEEERIHLLIRDLRPPFLDGKVVHTSQLETVQVVRDPTADLATVARKGSEVVRLKREIAEREKATKKNLKIEGTLIGNILGKSKKLEKEDQGRNRLIR
jgi:pre-mRNA-splicing factor ATP-dependent RNA helicase DHX38/PRP16